jgi:YegS/Rv2252/BmrU family lipid kinase
MNRQKIAFIINPIAGTSKKQPLVDAIQALPDFIESSVYWTERKGHATEIAQELITKGWEKIVAAGGDGTVNETACSLINSPVQLGIIPMGSGDGLARHLGIPHNLSKALDWIVNGVPMKIDYGTFNEKPFFCTAGVGFDAQVGSCFSNNKKRGFWTYVGTTLKEWKNYKPLNYKITVDGFTFEREAILITVANANQWGNNALIAPQADISDGFFDVVILSPFPWGETAEIGIRIFAGNIDQSRRTEYLKGKDILIERSSPGVIHLDGEPDQAGKNLKIQMHSQGLQVLQKPKKHVHSY